MAKHSPKHKHRPHSHHRNNGGGSPRPRRGIPRPQRGPKPDGWTAVSAVAGGVGASLVGGFAAREGYDPRWVGAGLAAAGGLTAWRYGGRLRAFASGVAAAGTGQTVLEWLDHDEKAKKTPESKKEPTKDAKAEDASDATSAESKPRGTRHGGDGLDRAFNRVRSRLQRMYDDDAADRFVGEDIG